jgi:hypothetical protein
MAKSKVNPEQVLRSWWTLHRAIMGLDEQQCEQLLQAERVGQARERFMLRIRSRMDRLRKEREKLDIHKRAKQ